MCFRDTTCIFAHVHLSHAVHLSSVASLPVHMAIVVCSSATIQNNLLHPPSLLGTHLSTFASPNTSFRQQQQPLDFGQSQEQCSASSPSPRSSCWLPAPVSTHITYIQLIREEVALTRFNLIYCRGAEEGHHGALLRQTHAGLLLLRHQRPRRRWRRRFGHLPRISWPK